ncbi:ABC transporter substrate-binding protein [Paenibacillaceae bacterium]|nr:ABC transporter substrate-binding protein [Paenibacillaceae bacterium]
MRCMLLLIAAAIVLSACGKQSTSKLENNPADKSVGSSPLSTEAAKPSAPTGSEKQRFEPVTVVDATGETIAFTHKVEKVACIVSQCIDVLAELGMEPIAIGESGVRVIATQQEYYGDKGKNFSSIGGSFFEPNLEDIVTAAPDLVIGLKGAHDGLREGLKGVAPIFLTNPAHYEESIAFLETIGKLTGKMTEAAAAKKRFLEKLAQAKAKSPKNKKAVIIFGSDVNISVITASGLGGSVLKEITMYPWEVENAADDPYGEGAVPYSLEKLLVENPDVIFVESYSYSPGTLSVSEQLKALPIWSKLKAVQDKQVHEVRSPIWGDGRGTRSLGILLDESIHILYPDLF